jgi:hypothetical protein
MLPAEQPFKTYIGLDGKPLDNGYVYFGQPNLNPVTSPVTVYWDAAGTVPAAQPLRTVNGYIMRGGTPANVFVSDAYSELVQDSKKRQVLYARTSTEFSIASAVKSISTFTQAGAAALARPIQDKLRDFIDARDFGVKGDGVTDDTAALQAALTACGAGHKLRIPTGTYLLSATLNAATNQVIEGDGPNNTILRRFTDYGDTIRFVNAGCGAVRGIWFYHGTMFNPTDTALTNKCSLPWRRRGVRSASLANGR